MALIQIFRLVNYCNLPRDPREMGLIAGKIINIKVGFPAMFTGGYTGHGNETLEMPQSLRGTA
jgi:hypothetical protein